MSMYGANRAQVFWAPSNKTPIVNAWIRVTLVGLALFSDMLLATPFIPAGAPAKTVYRICMQDKRWYPLSFIDDKIPKGIHVDILAAVFADLKVDYELVALPWKRCVEADAKSGKADAVLSAGWTQSRTAYLDYPSDAADLDSKPQCHSKFALMCVQASMIVPKNSAYRFQGDLSKVPEPIYINRGSRQVEEFKERGVRVETGVNDVNLVKMLLRGGKGSVLTLKLLEPLLLESKEFQGKIRAVSGFERSGDSHLAFSREGKIPLDLRQKIWQAFKERNQDAQLLKQLMKAYTQ